MRFVGYGWALAASAVAAAVVVGCSSGPPTAGAGGSGSSFSTGASSMVGTASPLATPSLASCLAASSGSGSTRTSVDRIGDASWEDPEDPLAIGPAEPPDSSIDLTRMSVWMTPDMVCAELTGRGTMEGSARGDRTQGVALEIRRGSDLYEAPIVCGSPCEPTGSWFAIPPFAFRVEQQSATWVATFAVPVAALGPLSPRYTVGAQSWAMGEPGGEPGVWRDSIEGELTLRRPS